MPLALAARPSRRPSLSLPVAFAARSSGCGDAEPAVLRPPRVLFNSLEFVLFFVVVYGVYLLLRRRAQNAWLLLASYAFYAAWDWRFLSLIWLSTVVDYTVARRIERASTRWLRLRWLSVSLVVNLGLLATFKYFGFFAETAAALASSLGVPLSQPTLSLVLPVGISFYTFQTLSYTIDVCRGELKACESPLNFALFVAFFPQLVAGPIERAEVLLPQIENDRRPGLRQLREGLWLVLSGYFLKMVLADNLAPYSARVFESPGAVHGTEIPVSLLAATFQIFGDFAGYSAIARGISKWMGFELSPNFRRPYLAVSPSDFWNRWHITLSRWLRDYLYIPMGGNRGGAIRTLRNLSITMLLGGLWHGDAWHFVLWGAYHALLLCLYRPFEGMISRFVSRGRWPLLRRLALAGPFFVLTMVGWALFFLPDVRLLPVLIENITAPFEVTGRLAALTVVSLAAPVMLLQLLQEAAGTRYVVLRWPPVVRLVVYAAMLAAILLAGNHGDHQFIYFQF